MNPVIFAILITNGQLISTQLTGYTNAVVAHEVGSDDQTEDSGKNEIHGVEVVYSEKYLINLWGLERLHPFDIHKYRKIVDKLVKDGVLDRKKIHQPKEVSEDDILLVQSKKFLKSLGDKESVLRYLEADILNRLPISIIQSGILKPFRYSTGGTILASELAIKNRTIAINVGGGYHHAKPDKGEGFCIYADIPIAIRKLQNQKKIKRALIIDVDAHQGNGTICCLADDDTTFCVSLHQKNIYPVPKERGDLDIELTKGAGDRQILDILKKKLPSMFEKSRPDIVFVVGGCDPLEQDPLAGLKMSTEGIVKRDHLIVKQCVDRKVPVVFTLAGGYSKNAWETQYASLKNLIKKFGRNKSGAEE